MKHFHHSLQFKVLTASFVVWWLGLQLMSLAAPNFLQYAPSFPYYESLLPNFGVPQSVYSWANFDGVHYLTIVEKGYLGTGLIQAFFPGYPLAVKLVAIFLQNNLVSGLVVSAVASYGLFLVWWLFLKSEFSEKTAWWGTWVLAVFPTSFYLRALYGESLFLLLVLSSWFAARQKRWLLAVILAALASGTRIMGVFLVGALIVEYWQQNWEGSIKDKKSYWLQVQNSCLWLLKRTWWFLFGATGLAVYMLYLYYYFHDPLYFLHVQAEFGAGRQENIVLLPQVFWRYLKILWSARPFNLSYVTYILESVAAGVVGIVLSLQILRYSRPPFRWGIWLFGLSAYLLPTLTGTFSSMPRYILVVLPLILGISLVCSKYTKVGYIWIGASTLLLIYTTILFIQGYWIA